MRFFTDIETLKKGGAPISKVRMSVNTINQIREFYGFGPMQLNEGESTRLFGIITIVENRLEDGIVTACMPTGAIYDKFTTIDSFDTEIRW